MVVALIGLVMAGCGGSGGSGGIQSGVAHVTPATYKISGTVSSSGTGLAGASVFLGGAGNLTAVTDVFGNYSFCRLANGSYTVTPAKSNYSCTPKASAHTVNGASIANVNFNASASSSICYVTDGVNLATVDLASGDVQVIGNTGAALTDIAFDQQGHLYGISYTTLYAIDKTNGTATPIGDLHISGTTQSITAATSLTLGDTGILYTATNELFAVNPATGALSMIGGGGYPYYSSGDLAFTANRMYLTSKQGAALTNNDLVSIDTATGKATLVGSIGYDSVFGLATNDNIHLYGFSGTKALSIDTSTGAGSLLFDFSGKGINGIEGAAFY
jgi:hypothetical protein